MDPFEPNIPQLFSINDFCHRFSVSRSQAYRIISRNELRLRKIGTASRISRADAEAWARNLPICAGASGTSATERENLPGAIEGQSSVVMDPAELGEV